MYTIYNKHIIQQLYRWSICFLPYYIELGLHIGIACIVNIRISNVYNYNVL